MWLGATGPRTSGTVAAAARRAGSAPPVRQPASAAARVGAWQEHSCMLAPRVDSLPTPAPPVAPPAPPGRSAPRLPWGPWAGDTPGPLLTQLADGSADSLSFSYARRVLAVHVVVLRSGGDRGQGAGASLGGIERPRICPLAGGGEGGCRAGYNVCSHKLRHKRRIYSIESVYSYDASVAREWRCTVLLRL